MNDECSMNAFVAPQAHIQKTNAQGLREYVVVYGKARVTEGGAVDLLQRLARIYLGPNVEYPPAANAEHCRLHHPNHADSFRRRRSVECTRRRMNAVRVISSDEKMIMREVSVVVRNERKETLCQPTSASLNLVC